MGRSLYFVLRTFTFPYFTPLLRSALTTQQLPQVIDVDVDIVRTSLFLLISHPISHLPFPVSRLSKQFRQHLAPLVPSHDCLTATSRLACCISRYPLFCIYPLSACPSPPSPYPLPAARLACICIPRNRNPVPPRRPVHTPGKRQIMTQ